LLKTPSEGATSHPHAETLTTLGWSDFFARQLDAASDLTPARVIIQQRGRLTLMSPDGPAEIPSPPDSDLCVGDWVLLRHDPARGVCLERTLERRTSLKRRASGTRDRPQVIAANLDRVFLVTSMNADFSPRRLERYLAAALAGGVEPVIVLTKADLRLAEARRFTAEAQAAAPEVPVVVTSAMLEMGLDELAAFLAPGITVGFVGSSGAGKSSLVNALIGEEAMVVHALRERDETGQHTTTHRELLTLPGGRGLLVDTPGMREFQPWSGDALGEVFSDLEDMAGRCRYRDCQHGQEPGCAIQEAIEAGELDPGRLKNWRKMEREVAFLEGRKADWELRLERKRFAKKIRNSQKNRP